MVGALDVAAAVPWSAEEVEAAGVELEAAVAAVGMAVDVATAVEEPTGVK